MSSQSSPSFSYVSEISLKPNCRLCGTALNHTVVDLGMSPPCESFRQENELGRMEEYYPLHVRVCEECMLVQLEEYVSRESIFEEYAYFSSYSTSWVEHAKRYCGAMIERFGLGGDSFVVEIASNDGYLLQHFVTRGIPVLGIEPAANVAKAAIARNVPTRIAFFGQRLADDMVAAGQQADLIAANNVLAQVPDLNDFLAGMRRILKSHGAITLEFPHVATLLAHNQFDTIYHEHFSYFSLLTVQIAARLHGLEVFDVEELPTHGGSLRIYLGHAGAHSVISPRVADLLGQERRAGLHTVEAYTSFAARARKAKRNLLYFLIGVKERGGRICGYGAPGKGNTLLNYCGIGTDFLDFTVDRNPYKHGRFTPGMHIPILPVEAIDQHRPDYILILPWNLKDEIVAQMRHVGDWGAKFIIPIPDVSIIDPAEAWS
ncbi:MULTISPECIES: class I SAM-dependent methyltransferase [unclassified Shinella]|uniref:class I SAM-dependent methyltransferase n=1 Tax=unclassified Shinella TaxID=2643062 RepID=UPI00068218BA|nr:MULTISPECIES: class I SAM-dependent methyltransferase [unclassified Shinella]KNY13575.1 SAM-dependent methyltransferase [Shinella sp. SUS2]KOC72370.1 SAM-dependent methyltransferase [Shinella sp. GWS1]MCO5151626.1 class I SAM-dependent methyltransferase [Shinella sp.]MDC7266367.1 class I SAM-dependent methyltransferase [Shinella sp. HY16]MDC7273264.1 class I SAM-dependent methyltransferase [Shinella sp. YZ44]